MAECLDFYDKRKEQLEQDAFTGARIAVEKYRNSDGTGIAPVAEDFHVTEGTETYLPIDDLKFEDADCTTGGYVDRWVLNHDKTYGELIDWKFGRWQVEQASNNLQGMAYALGLFRMFPTLQSIQVFFKQPLISYLTSHTFTRADIAAIYLRIQTIVGRARLARAKAATGDWSEAKPSSPLCNFCKHVGACEKVLEFACEVGKKFHPAGLPADITPSLVQDPANTKIAMELAAILKVWCDAFRRQVTDRVMRGDAAMPDGYEQAQIQKRELVDIEIYRTLALKYITKRDWESCLDTTFGAVEKKIAAGAERGSKQSTVEEFQALAAKKGATKLGDKISFLKVKSEKSTETKQTN